MNIGIFIYNEAEVLDFSGPFEVFSTPSRLCDETAPFKVFLISEHNTVVTARAGYKVLPDYSTEEHPPLDVLIISGGVHASEMKNKVVTDWIKGQSHSVKIIATVCTGIFFLAQAVQSLSCKVTTHWEDIPDLRKMFSRLTVVDSVRWVDEGNIVSSGGISAGIDMSLYLVSRLHSEDLAAKTAHQMEFAWTRNT
ncbi:DJ-1/PfpI family protein [Chromohalobacter israelensis]|uniref:ThiJ/PfpI n=1 Tax=Chromohalobacter israelensis (strain ATCC BAA-138 / DSM 3043 / CIP 106854 / NCIMB 13768 / 1H11) TaxID=290398 RepID=Q1QTS1_CHRI1|nr:DJ-1/PfpI family protein [Chromohalobacter salexigens]ABE60137.1 ThiJ/PfpI [Chromohalobacter salexigens DSM 3043]